MSKRSRELQHSDNEGVPLGANTPAYRLGHFLGDRFGASLVLGCSDSKKDVRSNKLPKNKVEAYQTIGRRAMLELTAAGILLPTVTIGILVGRRRQGIDSALNQPKDQPNNIGNNDLQAPKNRMNILWRDDQGGSAITEINVEQGSKSLIFPTGMPEEDQKVVQDILDASLTVVLRNRKLQESFQDATVIFQVAPDFHATLALQPSIPSEMKNEIDQFHGNAFSISGLRIDGHWYHHILIDIHTFENLPDTIVTLDHELGHLDKKERGILYGSRAEEERAVFQESIRRMDDVIGWMKEKNHDGSMDKHIRTFKETILPREHGYLQEWKKK